MRRPSITVWTKLEVIVSPTDTSGATVAVTVGNGGIPADEGGFVPLDNVGSNVNVIRVVVTAENGTDTETYTVTVTRGDTPADNVATPQLPDGGRRGHRLHVGHLLLHRQGAQRCGLHDG